jgi:hypothetical protein
MTDAAPPTEPAPAPPPAPPPPPELQPALAAFERGDFRAATAACQALLASPPSPEVAAAARALLARMAPDPWALRFGIAALALIALLVGIYIG